MTLHYVQPIFFFQKQDINIFKNDQEAHIMMNVTAAGSLFINCRSEPPFWDTDLITAGLAAHYSPDLSACIFHIDIKHDITLYER